VIQLIQPILFDLLGKLDLSSSVVSVSAWNLMSGLWPEEDFLILLSRQKPGHKARQGLLNNKGFHHRLLTDPTTDPLSEVAHYWANQVSALSCTTALFVVTLNLYRAKTQLLTEVGEITFHKSMIFLEQYEYRTTYNLREYVYGQLTIYAFV